MTGALPRLSVTDRYRLKGLILEQSQIVPAGKLWWCRGRKIIQHGTIGDLARVALIPKEADTLCVSAADYPAVKGWIG